MGAAIELLDADGESGLTFRALATRLKTGHGAIQWHVSNKDELLKAATADVVARNVFDADPDTPPRQAVHRIALGVVDAIHAHPWIGQQLTRPPWQSTMLQIFERIGQQIQRCEVPAPVQFTATSTLLIYILGAGTQEARNSRFAVGLGDRDHVLDVEAAHWQTLDAEHFSFTRTMADHLRTHDDRAEFIAGIDLILDGTGCREHDA